MGGGLRLRVINSRGFLICASQEQVGSGSSGFLLPERALE